MSPVDHMSAGLPLLDSSSRAAGRLDASEELPSRLVGRIPAQDVEQDRSGACCFSPQDLILG
jgi:hypothetical protein